MAWKPIRQAVADGDFPAFGESHGSGVVLNSSSVLVVSNPGTPPNYVNYTLNMPAAGLTEVPRIRITVQAYTATCRVEPDWIYTSSVYDNGTDLISNEAAPGSGNPILDPTVASWTPSQFEFDMGYDGSTPGDEGYFFIYATGDTSLSDFSEFEPFYEEAEFLVEIWVEGATPPSEETIKFSSAGLVHELERGWSFDGNYIPHFLELNWLFGEDPVTLHSVSKIRVHGLVKGITNLQVALSGMQGDVATDYISDYMEPQYIDFPFAPIHISSDFIPATNYVDYSDRGLAIQMKFEGRNTDITLPEPAHVIQVLALQKSPQGNGKVSN